MIGNLRDNLNLCIGLLKPLRNRKKYIILMGKRITERCREYFEALKRDDLDKGRVKTQSID